MSAVARARTSLRRAELALGRVQLDLLQRALARAAGLTPGVVPTSAGPIAVATRLRPDGPTPLVCVHGFGGDKETWLLLAPRVARRRGLVLIDLPGHGASAPIVGAEATPRRYAEVLAEVLAQLAIPRAVVVGNSLGGGVALHRAATAPDAVAGLVLVASVGPQSARSAQVKAWNAGPNPLIPGDDEAEAEAFLRLVTEKPPRVPRAILRYVASRRAGADARLRPLFAGYVQADGADGVPTLDRIRAPALIVHGERDRVVPVDTGRDLAAGLARARLHVMPAIGHAPQLEAPAATARAIAAFLREHAL